jgi:hypothetical protein
VASGAQLREQFRSYARSVILQAGEDVSAGQRLHAPSHGGSRAESARSGGHDGTIYNLTGDREALVVEIQRLRHEQLETLLVRTLDQVRPFSFREQASA